VFLLDTYKHYDAESIEKFACRIERNLTTADELTPLLRWWA